MDTIRDIVWKDGKQVVHDGIAAGVGALGAYATANAMRLADDIVTANIDGLEHLGVGVVVAVGVAAGRATRKVLARIFGNGS